MDFGQVADQAFDAFRHEDILLEYLSYSSRCFAEHANLGGQT